MEFYFARYSPRRETLARRDAGIAATVSTYYGAVKLHDEKSYIFAKGD